MFSQCFRVYYEDTDASGVMYHARYLAFFERARTEYLRALGFGQQQLMEQYNVAFTLSDLQVKYRQPARLDDELIVSVAVEKAGAASINFIQRMWRKVGDEMTTRAEDPGLAQMNVRAGCVEYPSFKVTRMPDAVRQAMKSPSITQ